MNLLGRIMSIELYQSKIREQLKEYIEKTPIKKAKLSREIGIDTITLDKFVLQEKSISILSLSKIEKYLNNLKK